MTVSQFCLAFLPWQPSTFFNLLLCKRKLIDTRKYFSNEEAKSECRSKSESKWYHESHFDSRIRPVIRFYKHILFFPAADKSDFHRSSRFLIIFLYSWSNNFTNMVRKHNVSCPLILMIRM